MASSSATASRAVLISLVLAALVLVILVARPFATAFFLAAVIAAALQPGMERLTRRLRGRREIAGGLLTFSVLMVVVIPVAAFTATVVGQVVDGVHWLNEVLRSEGVMGLVDYLPRGLRPAARDLAKELPRNVRDVQDLATKTGATGTAGNAATATVTAVGGVLQYTGNLVVQSAMMLIALYFFLVDGPKLVAWLNDAVPLKRGQFAELLADFRRVTVAVIVSTIATAGVQTIVALAGYLVASVPNPVFFTLVTFVLAMIPAIGAAVVVLLAAVVKLVTGHLAWAIFLAVWGTAVVGLVDNVMKPLLIRGGIPIHGGVIFFALLGGLAVFGPVGLVIGPLAVSFLVAVVRLYQRDYDTAA